MLVYDVRQLLDPTLVHAPADFARANIPEDGRRSWEACCYEYFHQRPVLCLALLDSAEPSVAARAGSATGSSLGSPRCELVRGPGQCLLSGAKDNCAALWPLARMPARAVPRRRRTTPLPPSKHFFGEVTTGLEGAFARYRAAGELPACDLTESCYQCCGRLLVNPHLQGGIWRLNRNTAPAVLSTHYDSVRAIAVRRPWVVTGSNDRTMALWRIVEDIEDRAGAVPGDRTRTRLWCQFRAHEKQVTDVKISHDAERIYSASIDGAIKMHVM